MPLVIVKADRRAREKPCLRCGYSLRKLFETKRCPECGLPIFISLGNNQTLEWSNPAWVRKLSLACWVLAGAQLLLLTIFIALHVWGSLGWIGPIREFSMRYLGIGSYLLIWHAATLLLAWPERRFPDKDRTLRIALQIVAGIGVLVGLLILYRIMANSFMLIDSLTFWEMALPLALIASHAIGWAYLRTLARRLPNRNLTRLASIAVGTLLLAYPIGFYGLGWVWVNVLRWIYVPASAVVLLNFGLSFDKARVSAAENWAIEV